MCICRFENHHWLGRVFAYKRLSGKWSCVSVIISVEASESDVFGIGLAINNDVALIGGLQSNAGAGAAYMYVRLNAAWTYLSKISSPESNNAHFTHSLSFDGQNVVGGAHLDNTKGTIAGTPIISAFP